MFIVYRHIVDNNVIYIGMGQKSRSKDYVNRSQDWKQITEGKEVISEVLWKTDSRKEAYDKEIEFINLYGRVDTGKGTLINKTDGGGWLKGAIWSKERIKMYSQNAKKRGNLKKWQKINGAAVKGKKLPKQKQEHIEKRVESIKTAWKNKTQEEKNKQTTLFINNNPSNKIQDCKFCGRSIKGASAFKRFHGENCKENLKRNN